MPDLSDAERNFCRRTCNSVDVQIACRNWV